MSSKTKIVVLRMKEIIYTSIFIGLGIILVTLLFIMFRPKKEPHHNIRLDDSRTFAFWNTVALFNKLGGI